MAALGEALRAARIAADMRTQDVKDELGVGWNWMAEVESGRRNPNGHLETMCDLYGINKEELPKYRPGKDSVEMKPKKTPRKKPARSKKANNVMTQREKWLDVAAKCLELGDAQMAMMALQKGSEDEGR